MRADRLLSILMLLQTHGRLTARELAARLEVSERTVHRDMDALSAAGVPVFAQRGASGGWALLDEFRSDLTGLTAPEVQALFASTPARVLADLGFEQPAKAAVLKLFSSLSEAQRGGAEHARARLHVDGAGWGQRQVSLPQLGTLQEAVWRDRRLRMRYRRGSDPREGEPAPVERTVDPLGLVAKGRAWYLVAAAEGQVRSYRVSRIVEVAVLDEPVVRPPEFDLATFWEQSMATFRSTLPRYEATVRVAPRALRRVHPALLSPGEVAGDRITVQNATLWGPLGDDAAEGQDGAGQREAWPVVTLHFEVEEEAVPYVLGFGGEMEVVAPESLQERVLALARGTVGVYECSGAKAVLETAPRPTQGEAFVTTAGGYLAR